MAQKSAGEIRKALTLPFAPEDLEWRLQKTIDEKQRGLAVPYVTNRAIQNRLDEVVGPENWYNDYKPWHSVKGKESQLCGIAIYFEARDEWVMKWDGAEDSDIEPVKGGLSDSMKRAAVQWGIGRVLYNMDSVWVSIEKRGKTWEIVSSERARLDKAYLDMLKKLGLTAAPPMGTQSQLTSKAASSAGNGNEAPQSGKTDTEPLPIETAEKPEAKITQLPVSVLPPEPAFKYKVTRAKVEQSMSGAATKLDLESADGKKYVNVFARGALDELRPGTLLEDAQLVSRVQDNVAFYMLTGYRLAQTERAA